MEIQAENSEIFILLNGISVTSDISLGDGVLLQPADTSHISLDSALAACTRPDDIAVVTAIIPRVRSQFRISAPSPREAAIVAWNSAWDASLLSAIFQTEVGFNLQSDTTAGKISASSNIRAIHRHMNGFDDVEPYSLTTGDAEWISRHYSNARILLESDSFQTAVQCLSSHRWHPNPRIKLAIIWAGIEAIFEVSSEVRFRISICIARFISGENAKRCREEFDLVKRLYDARSKAVHGARMKGNLTSTVIESANLLNRLILKCIENGSLPVERELIP